MKDFILLVVNGEQHQVRGADAFLTLSTFLRTRLKLSGTKIVCSEGDCGSCSVLCNRIDDESRGYFPIDSCIQFVFQLDRCHIVTVEGLACQGKLNSVQEAMIDCHGSQCGFCTPGFVVTMTGILEENSQPTVEDWRHGLTGNLCRCTGYTPIIEAGKQSCSAGFKPVSQHYDLDSLVGDDADTEEPIEIKSAGENPQTLHSARTIDDAVKYLDENPDAKIIAGATDVGVQFNKGYCKPQKWLDLSRIDQLKDVAVEGDNIVAGACATWTDFENLTEAEIPELYQIISVFGSPQIRNVGTIGGNIVNASPIADSIPFLYVSDAKLELTSASGTRTVNINDFYLDYKKFDLQPGELLTKIVIPLPAATEELKLYKISRRRDLDISTFTAAIKIMREGDTIKTASIAYGAVGPVVLRLPKTESFLVGRELSLETMQLAGDIAVDEITPITDVRGGSDYRFQLARNVLLKFFHQTQTEGVIA